MKIRWINTEVKPLPHAASWIKFICKYPFLLFFPIAVFVFLASFFFQKATEFEAGLSDSLYLGKFTLLYNLFGKWGVPGFFIFLIICCLYGFWFYAISKPKDVYGFWH